VIRAVLFDLDGTLADTAPDMARTVNGAKGGRSIPSPSNSSGRTCRTARAA
jgi:phosphoglycolate phosphatase-like HAD superfamily hydrolase